MARECHTHFVLPGNLKYTYDVGIWALPAGPTQWHCRPSWSSDHTHSKVSQDEYYRGSHSSSSGSHQPGQPSHSSQVNYSLKWGGGGGGMKING